MREEHTGESGKGSREKRLRERSKHRQIQTVMRPRSKRYPAMKCHRTFTMILGIVILTRPKTILTMISHRTVVVSLRIGTVVGVMSKKYIIVTSQITGTCTLICRTVMTVLRSLKMVMKPLICRTVMTVLRSLKMVMKPQIHTYQTKMHIK